MSVDSITLWHKRARPSPTEKDFNVQLGCHLEEIGEMLRSIEGEDPFTVNKLRTLEHLVTSAATGFKLGTYSAWIQSRKEFLDSCCDQVVAAVGAAHCANMKVSKAVDIVNQSNWSKFDENGQPYFDENGKVKKGPKYIPPDLEECL